jgi:hypothetical protein
VCASSPRLNKCSFSSYPLKAKMWSSWVKRKGTTQVMYIFKLKDGLKRAKKIFSMILKWIFNMVWWRRGKWNHIKNNIFEVEVFFSSQNIDFPFIWRDSWSFSFSYYFFFLFFNNVSLSSFLCSVCWGLGGFDNIWGEKSLLQKLSFQIEWHGMTWSCLWIYWRWTYIPKWSYTRQYS